MDFLPKETVADMLSIAATALDPQSPVAREVGRAGATARQELVVFNSAV
jgi:hypothetical protein